MSAFVVELETINQIVSFVDSKANYGMDSTWWSEYSPFAKLGYKLTTQEGLTKLANDLYHMNIEAVNQRYGGDCCKPGIDYNFVLNQYSPIATFKLIRCLVYQCSEGDVDTCPLYEALEKTGDLIARDVIQDMPEFQRANWG